MQEENANLMREAQTLLNENRLSEAGELCRRICEQDDTNGSAWCMLGRINRLLNNLDGAILCYTRSVNQNPADAAACTGLAGALLTTGESARAYDYCRKAINLRPDATELWWELGNLTAQLEKFTDTEQCCREVINREPSFAAAHLYLGVALQRQRRFNEAEDSIQKALQLNPDLAEAYFHLAVIQQAMDKVDSAIGSYRRALESGVEPSASGSNISQLLVRQGKLDEALECAFTVVRHNPENIKYRQIFVRMLRFAAPAQASGEMVEEIINCFTVKGLDQSLLMKPLIMLLIADERVNQLVQLACNKNEPEISKNIVSGKYTGVFENVLLKGLLLHTKIASSEFETLVTVLRSIALSWVMENPEDMPSWLYDDNGSFLTSLAHQFFNTEYAGFVTDSEAAKVKNLFATLDEFIRSGAEPDFTIVLKLIVLSMYLPLHSLQLSERFIASMQQLTGDVLNSLIKIQIHDYFRECSMKSEISALSTIGDEVSGAVRAQYEESPYPRWQSVEMQAPQAYRDVITAQFPDFDPPEFGECGLDILVAGCGTGRHAIMTATSYRDSNVLAIDLSLSSLAYARRNADELGVSNITFAHADILELGSLDRRFHIIESVGVLHHMGSPESGLQILSGLLHEGGLIRLGFYSEQARRDVVAGRKFISKSGFRATPEGIRLARREIVALDDGHPARAVVRYRDFYTLSECRDLLFHIQEKRYRWMEIMGMLERCGLKFIGFMFADPQTVTRFQSEFPDDDSMSVPGNWELFESRHPDTFTEMYQFMCQKT